MRFIDTLESKLGRFAIPGLVQVIAMLQLAVMILSLFMTKEAVEEYLQLIMLDVRLVAQGEVWRLVTFLLVPATQKPFMALLSALFLLFCGNILEAHWGAFRTNLYVFAWVALALVLNWLFFVPLPTYFLNQSLFFAFATLFPDEEINLYGVLPIKAKWLALIFAGDMLLDVIKSPLLLLVYVYGHLNYLVSFVRFFFRKGLQAAKVTDRRSRFQQASVPADSFFHQCVMCKKTELDDPKLEFRVLDSGDEICSVCRAAKKSA